MAACARAGASAHAEPQSWEPDATEMLGKVQPLAPAEVVPILTEYGFTVTFYQKSCPYQMLPRRPGTGRAFTTSSARISGYITRM